MPHNAEMTVKRISFRNFRNIESADIRLSEGTTVLIGKNGQGKTNCLEGIYIFAQGRSFRTRNDSELVKFGKRFAAVELEGTIGAEKPVNTVMNVKWDAEKGKRYCTRAGFPVRKMSEMMGTLRAVLFCPEHLRIIKDGPAARRSFLDMALSQLEPLYLKALQKYGALISRRNVLLKNAQRGVRDASFNDMISVLSEQLAAESEKISLSRAEYTEKLGSGAEMIFSDMTNGKEKPEFIYKTQRTKEEYYRQLVSNIENEIKYGVTLYGIHKDDIEIRLNSHDARSFASQGQQRSLALAMKLAEGGISKEYTGEYPLFLFDDVLSELDSQRREYLINGLTGRQVVMTSCETVNSAETVYGLKNGCIVSKEDAGAE